MSVIRNGNYRRIALQFPDSYLSDAPAVVGRLKGALKVKEPLQFSFGLFKTQYPLTSDANN